MYLHLNRISTCLVFLHLVFYSFAQTGNVYHLDVSDGLSQNSVGAIYQDERDYIWFGTRNGLNLYNGKNFTVFKNEKNDPSTLPNSEVKQLAGDGKGHLYIRTAGGAVLSADISSYAHEVLVPSRATSLCFSPQGLYCSLSHRIVRFKGKVQEEVFTFDDDRTVITSLIWMEEGLYIGTLRHGVYLLDSRGKLEHPVESGNVTSLFRDSCGELWVTLLEDNGLVRIREGKVLPLALKKARACTEDLEGNIWIGTNDGLFLFDRKSDSISRAVYPDFNRMSVISLMTDRQGTVWAGSYFHGVRFFNPGHQTVRVFHSTHEGQEGLTPEVIRDIAEDRSGNIWFATADAGVNVFLKGDDRIVSCTREEGLLSDTVNCLYLDDADSCVWVGTYMGGMSRLDLKTGTYAHFIHRRGDPDTLPSDVVRDIIPYDGDLLLAVKGGVVRFDKKTGRCTPFFTRKEDQKKSRHISQMLLDRHGNIWLLHTSNGAFRFNPDSGELESFQNMELSSGKISPGRVNAVLEDSFGRIWFCNNQNGLDMYDYQTGLFSNFDKKNINLSSNTIYAAAEMAPDRLIVTTDNGYSVLMIQENSSLNYLNNKSIPLVAANERSLLVASDGKVYIGGLNGIMSIDSRMDVHQHEAYAIRPFQLTVDGCPVRVNDESGILKKDLSQTDRIVIGPEVTSFAIEYAITDYLPFDRDDFYYRLEGETEKWTRLDASNIISFTNLRPGRYHLAVKSDDMGQPGSHHEMTLVVRPPFYRTVWAYLLYLCAAIFILSASFRIYRNRLRRLEEEKLNQYKLAFFTQISHEFRTPLTVIIAQMEQMMDRYHRDKTIYGPLKRIYSSCMQLKYLFSELLDFRKQEQGCMKLRVGPSDWTGFIHEQFLNFQLFARQKGYSYRFIDEAGAVMVWFDPMQMQKVLNNLIFNALKNVDAHGSVSVKVGADESAAWVEIINTGKGLSKQEISHIFKPFYQTDFRKNKAGTGIGLALVQALVKLHHGEVDVTSIPGVETVFRVRLKMGHEHFRDEELQPDDELSASGMDSAQICETVLTEVQDLPEEERLEDEDKEGTLLIIEDDAPLRATLRQLFMPFYHILEAADGEEGLRTISAMSVDLVISDIMMPVMDGLEFCRQVKTDKKLSHIPVVLLTAKAEESQKLEGLRYGADDYILKPFNSRELVSRCNNIVRNHQLLREKFAQEKSSRLSGAAVTNTYQDQDFISKLRAVVAMHISEKDFHVDDLAHEMVISRTYLFTRLRAILNMTPMEFIFNEHLHEAERLLKEEPDLSITSVSERAGFSSPKVFRKMFKDKYGTSPSQYRKSL